MCPLLHKTWRACVMSSELFMSCCLKDVLLHPHGWGSARRQGIDATWYLSIQHITCTFLDLNLKWLCPGAMAQQEVLSFEKFGWIRLEFNFFDCPLTETDCGAGCWAGIPAGACILEENPIGPPDCWIRGLSLELFLSWQCVDLCGFYIFLSQGF